MENVAFGGDSSVVLSLPVSKFDSQAKGCKRSWSCICKLGYPCPSRILLEYDARLPQEDRIHWAWILGEFGNVGAKAGKVAVIIQGTERAGEPAGAQDGKWLQSGRIFKFGVVGAGCDQGSSAVLSCLAEAPLLRCPDLLKNQNAN
eukprot:Skav225222  [mRNA]  locus=scaffold1469:44665:45102:+ [translate_table: standard]